MAIRSRVGARPAPGQRPCVEWLEIRCVLSAPTGWWLQPVLPVEGFIGPAAYSAPPSAGPQPAHGQGHAKAIDKDAQSDASVDAQADQDGNGHHKAMGSGFAANQDSDGNGAQSGAQSFLAAINTFLQSLIAEFGYRAGHDSANAAAAGAADNDASAAARQAAGGIASVTGSTSGIDASAPGTVSLDSLVSGVDAGSSRAAAAGSGGGMAAAVHAPPAFPTIIDGASAAQLLRDHVASVSQANSVAAGDVMRDGKNLLVPDSSLSKQAAAALRFGPAGFIELGGDDQPAEQILSVSEPTLSEGSAVASGAALPVLAAEGSARLLDGLPTDGRVLQEAMQRFFDRLESLEEGMGVPALTKAAVGPWLVGGAVLTVAGDAARRRARKTGGWASADRVLATEPWGATPGLSF
jgi:hypothetical protein